VKARRDPIIFADGEGRGQRASRGLGGVHRVDVLVRAVFCSFD
jgi:hypothetical protein